ncbi:MAG TPA: hypothetical protein VK466_11870, partial [Terriglobales bacterium]|nr:hypothetical protein [Terriglobales bacterium]
AADGAAGMVSTDGTAWINGGTIPKTMAVFSGDLVQTRSDSMANIKASKLNVLVFSDSLVQFEPQTLKLEHGRVNVLTYKDFSVRVGELKIAPKDSSRTSEFEISDTDGVARIIARKGDLMLDDGKGVTTVPEGKEASQDDSDKNRKRRGGAGAVPGAAGGILDSPVAIGIGAAAIGGLATWVYIQSDDPVSPKR